MTGPNRRSRRLLLALLPLAGLLVLASCSNLGYVGQAAWGQGRILLNRQSIAKLVARPDTPAELKEKLRLVTRIRKFAIAELALPADGSFTSYVELPPAADGGRRTSVLWNVVAAPELSTAPVTWCFPVAGCVSYRGYFAEERARRYGERLRLKGYDVSVGGAAAYSTLGWFEDPLLSTVVDYPEPYLAGLIFHELAHQLVYVKDDTRFNESFASVVEVEGVRRWLASTGQPASAMEEYRARERRQDEVVGVLLDFRERLREVYAQERSEDWKRERKGELFERLKDALEALEHSESNAAAGRWARRPLNNADLASVGDYHGLGGDFRRLLAMTAREDGSLEAFYRAVRELAELPPESRLQRLRGGSVLTVGTRHR